MIFAVDIYNCKEKTFNVLECERGFMKKIASLKKKRTEGSSNTSIRKRITSAITAIIITLSLVLGALSAYLTYASTVEALQVSMKETAKLA